MPSPENKMGDDEKVVKHLEMIQSVINRLGSNSFLIKSWSMGILAAGVIFIARSGLHSGWLVLAFPIIIIGFWILDSYFLRQERLFREVYNDVRMQTTTDFEMDLMKHKTKSKCKRRSAIFSETTSIFYAIEFIFVAAVSLIILW